MSKCFFFVNSIAKVGSRFFGYLKDCIDEGYAPLRALKFKALLSLLGLTIGAFCIFCIQIVQISSDIEQKKILNNINPNIMFAQVFPPLSQNQVNKLNHLGQKKGFLSAQTVQVPASAYYQAKELNTVIIALEPKIFSWFNSDITFKEGDVLVAPEFEELSTTTQKAKETLSEPHIQINHKLYGIQKMVENSHKIAKFLPFDISQCLFIPYSDLKLYSNQEEVIYLWFYINADSHINKASLSQIQNTIANHFDNPSLGIVHQWRFKDIHNIASGLVESQTQFQNVLKAIAVMAFILGMISSLNLSLAQISARTSEIALKLSLGATSKHIIKGFLCEAMVLNLFSGGLAILLGLLCFPIMAMFFSGPLHFGFGAIFYPLLSSVFCGLAVIIYPAILACRYQPAQLFTLT